MRSIICALFLFYTCSYLSALEHEDPDEFSEFGIKGIQQDIDQDISKMEIALSTEFEPLSVVAGCVNVSSGDFFQVDHDFVGDTIDPIRLTRFYDDNNYYETFLGFKFGCQFPLLATETQDGARHTHALIEERNGFFMPYLGSSSKHVIHPRLFRKGYTNLSGDKISAQSNHINWSANFRDGWEVEAGNGSKRIYSKKFELIEDRRRQLGIPKNKLYLLTEEIKPNGNRLKFDYETYEGKPCLSKVQTINKQGQELNFIKFQYSNALCVLESSCGKRVEYLQHRSYKNVEGVFKNILVQVNSSQKGLTTYDNAVGSLPNVYRVNKPDGRFVRVGFINGQVARLMLNDATYHFTYNKHETIVDDPLEQVTSYQFDSNKRLETIDYLENGKSVRRDEFAWSAEDGREGRLKTKAIMQSKEYHQLWKYSYDKKGNVREKRIYGNLTGETSDSFRHKEETDHYSTYYTYSQDKRNLLLSQKTAFDWTISYSYLPDTNLRSSILQAYSGKVQERVFNTYDVNGEIEYQIEDDGNSTNPTDFTDVTYRRFTKIITDAYSKDASFGKPLEIIEGYFLSGREQILNIKRIQYDSQGRMIAEHVNDSKGALCFTTRKTYDSFSRIVSESNPLGHVTQFSYNDSHQKISEELVGSGKITFYDYDHSGRMISKTEKHTSGETFEKSYVYDAIGQLISETDIYGNETTYTYDRLGRQIEKCFVADGAVTRKKYNLLDQVIEETDPNGNTTLFSYNIYGGKTKIIHPDGSQERLVYFENGWLKQHWKVDGTSIHYGYDPKGRIVEEKTFNANGELLKSESFKYKGKLLIEKKDAMGLVTAYVYDKAGRKIQEKVGTQVTLFSYDDFSNITKIVRPLGATELYTYDYLGRVISKTLQDPHGKIYGMEVSTYDIQGNEIEKKCLQNEDQWVTYSSQYGSDGRILWSEDPQGNRTSWEYNHHFINEKGLKVAACTIKDALNRIEIEINDIFGRLARKDLLEDGELVSRKEYSYDKVGHEIEKRVSVFNGKENIRDYWVVTSYDKMGFLASETEMPEGKTTRYTYNSQGQLIQKVKPDGVVIDYDYDALGRTCCMHSQDVHYTYSYDLHDNPIEAHDHIDHTVTKMSYDLKGNLLTEEVSPNIAMSYSYDDKDRLTKIELPDGSSIAYVYDPFHLIKVQRYTSEGNLVYTCSCPSYDLRGNRLQDVSPAGCVTYAYNERNRKTTIDSAFWKASLEAFDPVGNLLSMSINDPSGLLQTEYAYNRFDHLIKDQNHSYQFDNLGNCLKKNSQPFHVNHLNQLTTDSEAIYSYDLNGNLISQSNPARNYTYDALNRLKTSEDTCFTYDAFGRCSKIAEKGIEKSLLYLEDQEIGCLVYDQIQELKIVHPEANQETTFAIEINNQAYFPIQDDRYNVTALRHIDGSLIQYSRFSPYGEEQLFGDTSVDNPWRFANRRQINGLSLFSKRFYNPKIMRWQTPDPLGFEDGLNLYAFAHNNPLRYYDRDGQYAWVFVIELFTVYFGTAASVGGGGAAVGGAVGGAAVATTCTVVTVDTMAVALAGALITGGVVAYDQCLDHNYNKEDVEDKEKDNDKPPYAGDKLGEDPSHCPQEGFKWRGRGKPGSREGSYLNEETLESLRPDFHTQGHKPHWDYRRPDQKEARLNTDGTWEWK